MEFEPLNSTTPLPGDGTGYTILAGKGARLQYFSFYRLGNVMATIGFDDGTKGFFYNEMSADSADCVNTCATPRSQSLSNTEFIDCTTNYTNCFDNDFYWTFFAPSRTYNDNINQVKVAFMLTSSGYYKT